MNYIFLGNNRVGFEVLKWLVNRGEPPIGLVVHPLEKAKWREEIISVSGLSGRYIFDGSAINNLKTVSAIRELKADLGISVLFDYILKNEIIKLFPRGCLNLHPAFLPYNRGQYPNVWSIVEGTPSGVTLHYIDEGIDTGDIILQKRVQVDQTDTGESLYRKLEKGSVSLFQEAWPLICSGEAPRKAQNREGGTFHRKKDVEKIDKIDLEGSYIARDLLNIIRARTFPPYRGAYFFHEGRRIFIKLALEEEINQ